MSTYLEWGNLAWPYRRIINMVGSDAGELNWQMECGHVVWMRGILTLARMGGPRALRQWKRGDQKMFTRCRGCALNLPGEHPVGVKLPLYHPPQTTHGEISIPQEAVDRANRDK